MAEWNEEAVEAIDQLHSSIDYGLYCTIRDGLDEIPTIEECDKALEGLWSDFTDVPMNPETECMEAPFLGFPAGTHREEIWHWFDDRHSRGVHFLLYGKKLDATSSTKHQFSPVYGGPRAYTEEEIDLIIALEAKGFFVESVKIEGGRSIVNLKR